MSRPTYRCSGCGVLNRVASPPQGKKPICGRCRQALDTSGAPQAVSAEELEKVVAQAPVPVLVDFWAPWCPPCRVAGPIFDRLARARPGKLIALKVNGDENPAASGRHRVEAIPSFLLFRGGRELGRQRGLLAEPAFARWI